jgi:hypothetical protein
MKKFLTAFLFLLCTYATVFAQNATTWPQVAITTSVFDFGNGPLQIRVVRGSPFIFASQGSGTGSTAGSSTTLTLTSTPATPPCIGCLITGTGITAGTTVVAYNGTTGITLSAAMTVAASTPLNWGAACPSTYTSPYYVQGSPQADYWPLYTTARVCGISPGGPSSVVITLPYAGSATTNVNLAQYNGAAVGATNAQYVQPGTGAVWAVTQSTTPWAVAGNVASGIADSGNPVKTGGVFNTTPPTVSNGQRVDGQSDNRGSALVNARTTPYTGADGVANTLLGSMANTGTGTTTLLAIANAYFNGTTWDRVRGNTFGAFSLIQDAAGNARGMNVNAANQGTVIDAATGATGSAVPTNAGYVGARTSGGLTGFIGCDSNIVYDASTNGSTQLVALSGGTSIYVCAYSILAAGTVNVELDYGTGSNCGTGTTKITPAYQLTAQAGMVESSPFFNGMKAPAGNALCAKTNAAIAVQIRVSYTQF